MDDFERLTTALANSYAVEREIGSGGMATVYLARDLKHDRKVAVKVLKPELAAVMGTDRFLAEIRTTANLTHPHILPLFDSGEADGFLFYVMPYIEGETLRQRLDREGQLPVEDVVRITGRIADALEAAHRHGVIHRDLKPDNVLFQDGEPVVADFGIALAGARAGGARLTQTGMLLGTPQYMSPEQFSGESEIEPRCDVYALGAVAYEMLTGETAHTGKTAQAMFARRLLEQPTPITDLRESVPAHVHSAVHKALARSAADRFQTAAEFADAITKTVEKPAHGRPKRQALPWAVAVSAVVALAAAVLLWKPWSTPMAEVASVAVLPLADLSGDGGQSVVVDGLHDALILELQKISAFDRVISRTSVLQFRDTELPIPEIARALDVDAVIDGTVVIADNSVGVRVTLIGAFPERNLWSERYESDIADVLTLQRTITSDIAREISLTLTPTEGAHLAQAQPVNPEAFNLVLLGREAWNLRDAPGMRRAAALFNQAIEIDPTYADAHIGLSDVYDMAAQYDFMPPEEGIALALESVKRALALDSTEGRAYASLGEVHFLDRDWTQAEQAYRRAIALNPGSAVAHHFFGWFLSHLGRHDEAIAMLSRARDLDPLSAPISADLAAVYLHARRYDEAWAETERTLTIARGFHRAIWLQMVLDLLVGTDIDRAVSSASQLEASEFTFHRSALAHALAAAGREDEARSLLEEAIANSGGIERLSKSGALLAATAYLELGDTAKAWDSLRRVVDVRTGSGITSLIAWPFLDPIRDDPRFADLVSRMGYPQ